MKMCSHCGKNPATVYYKQTVNGKTVTYALCGDCAAHYGGELFGGFSAMDAFADPMNLFGSLFGAPTHAHTISAPKHCSFCGADFNDLRRSGKIGCAKCYDTFRTELTESIASMHGSNARHIGRAPAGHAQKRKLADQREELQKQLRAAIDTEDFESAAKLRDALRALDTPESEQK